MSLHAYQELQRIEAGLAKRKLTADDLDAAIYRDSVRPPFSVVRMRNGNEELLVATTRRVGELPPLDIPQPTEPFSIGSTFKKPAPPRSMWDAERKSPWLVLLYLLAFLGVILFSHLARSH